MNTIYILLSSLFIAVGAYLVATALLDETKAEVKNKTKTKREILLKSPSFRLFVRSSDFLMSLHPKRNKLSGYFSRVRKRLLLAGEPLSMTPEEFLALKELTAISAVLIGMFFGFSITITGILIIACFFYPDLWLKELYKKRRAAILKELPYTLDLLTLSIEAGLDLTGSVSRVVEKSKQGIFNMELFQFLQELKMGKPRKEALTDMSVRIGVPEVTSLVNAIIQSDELGSGLAVTLKIQSQEYRTRRFQHAEKLAMEAPVKMTFPLLFIFVAVFLLLFGSFAVQALRGKLF